MSEKIFSLLHCVSSYPVISDEANLLAIRTFKTKFPELTMSSDHCEGIKAAILQLP